MQSAADAMPTQVFDHFITFLFCLRLYEVTDVCDPGATPDTADSLVKYLFRSVYEFLVLMHIRSKYK